MKMYGAGVIAAMLFLLLAQNNPAFCAEPEKFAETIEFGDFKLELPIGIPADMFKAPTDNPVTKEKVKLGRLLFFDVRLSADDTISCATCHSPDGAFTDNLPVSFGINGQKGIRSAPAILNRAFSTEQFWDGRAASLEAQAKAPIINPDEMGMPSHEALVRKLAAIKGYSDTFKKVFKRKINIDDIAKAIASFERTILSGGSAADMYNYGDENALSKSQKRGLDLFKGKARCEQCHAGFNLTDEKYHNIGVGWGGPLIDLGRYTETKQSAHIGAFKTPTLRNIAETAPYMHDGSMETLEEVVEFYDMGGEWNPFIDSEMKRQNRSLLETLEAYEKKNKTKEPVLTETIGLNLTKQEKEDIVEFLKALSGTGWSHITAPDSFPE